MPRPNPNKSPKVQRSAPASPPKQHYLKMWSPPSRQGASPQGDAAPSEADNALQITVLLAALRPRM